MPCSWNQFLTDGSHSERRISHPCGFGLSKVLEASSDQLGKYIRNSFLAHLILCWYVTQCALRVRRPMSIFIILFVILVIAWILGWTVFHVASALIHILLVVALVALVLHFIRGRRTI